MVHYYFEGVSIGSIALWILVYWLDRFGFIGYSSWREFGYKDRQYLKAKLRGDDIYRSLPDLRATWPAVQFSVSMFIVMAFPFNDSVRIMLFLSINMLLESVNIYKTILSMSYLIYMGAFTIYFIIFPVRAGFFVIACFIIASIFLAWWIGKHLLLAGGFAVQSEMSPFCKPRK